MNTSFLRAVGRGLHYRASCIRLTGRVFGDNGFRDLRRLLRPDGPRVIFDVGANVGQTSRKLTRLFRAAQIHAFEPSPETFQILQRRLGGRSGIQLHKLALGSEDTTRVMHLKKLRVGDSLLPRASEVDPEHERATWLQEVGRTEVPVMRLDTFCREQRIERVDLLKIDTQGYELRVLEGAGELLRPKTIGAVMLEATLGSYYQGQSNFEDLYALLRERGYRLIGFYGVKRNEQKQIKWCDAIFTPCLDRHADGGDDTGTGP